MLGMLGVLDPLQLLQGAFICHVSCVQGGNRLEHKSVDLVLGHGPMLHACRNDEELPLRQVYVPVSQLDGEPALGD